jgi:FAD/FMN-containing dehydrogenase
MRTATQTLAGWGNCPVERCQVARPDTVAAIREAVLNAGASGVIARGLGRAYGDSALNRDGLVATQTGLNRFLAFNPETGVLKCEAGVSFAEIVDTFLPRGWFLPTTPGTKFVTVGGAIAADVHGKNHHVDGSFGNFVDELELLTGTGEAMTCSPSKNADVFWATVGGMGLTGVILTATIRLHRVETAYYDVTYRRTRNLDESLDVFAETDEEYRYSVAWIDCLARGSGLGRSVLMLGRDARREDLPSNLRGRPLQPAKKREKTVPFDFPGGVLNPWSVRSFNTLYYAAHANARRFVDYDAYFYPLDGIRQWNRIYGRRGFVQYQALFPKETSRAGLVRLLEKVAQSGRASFLAVLKSSGAAGQGMLSYLAPGHTLALDFPNTGESLRKFTAELDRILLDHGGRLYLAKDALMSPETFAAMYPCRDEFLQVKRRIDPHGRFMSSQARRLALV